MSLSEIVRRQWQPLGESSLRKLVGGTFGLTLLISGCGGSGDDSAPVKTAATPRPVAQPAPKPGQATDSASLDGLAASIQAGDAQALAAAFKRSMAMPNLPEVNPPAPTTSEIGSWKRVITACGEHMDKFEPDARKVMMRMAGQMLVMVARDGVPVNWSDLLDPVRAVLAKGSADADCEVRAAAIDQVSIVWDWVPGRDIFTVERNTLAAWKGGMLQLVQPHLKDAEIPSRLAAMRCLASLPIDTAAAPALELLKDKESFVRVETIRHFAGRNGLISEEQLLSMTTDEDSLVAQAAVMALSSRGISEDQIALGRSILSKNPQERISVIARLDESMDIDPGIWLARLVEDPDASVRLKALEAIANRKVSRELIRRIQVISEKDASDAVRKSAEKVLRSQTTASVSSNLPPLPPAFDKGRAGDDRPATLRAN
ncbi:hypothetical protein GC170_03590 [bacterium]|nr:hypothetical protein [bacterium]